MADQQQQNTSGDTGKALSAARDVESTESDAGANGAKSVWLPVVVPREARQADDDGVVIDEWPAPGRMPPPRAAGRTGWMRWLTGRAAVIAAAAAIGGLVGAAAATGMGQVLAARDDGPGAEEAVEALRTSIGQLATEIKALKDGVGEGSRAATGGLAALDQRLQGAERAQADLTAQVASLSQGLSERQRPEAAAVSPEVTGSITRGRLPVANDWVLWRVRNGRALVQGNGGYFEVVPGSSLPGLGLVQRIVKEDGRWMVLTRNGIIVARG